MEKHKRLKRLPSEYYQGLAVVHWTMTINDRKTGWLNSEFHLKFRELFTHCLFRYSLCCPIYCCMPDHFHMLLMGLTGSSDQLKAIRFFRKHLNQELAQSHVKLQTQAYDHVLREDESQESAFGALVEYIARNPERKGLIEVDQFRDYPYSGSSMPGYPEISVLNADGWESFWRAFSFIRKNGSPLNG